MSIKEDTSKSLENSKVSVEVIGAMAGNQLVMSERVEESNIMLQGLTSSKSSTVSSGVDLNLLDMEPCEADIKYANDILDEIRSKILSDMRHDRHVAKTKLKCLYATAHC